MTPDLYATALGGSFTIYREMAGTYTYMTGFMKFVCGCTIGLRQANHGDAQITLRGAQAKLCAEHREMGEV